MAKIGFFSDSAYAEWKLDDYPCGWLAIFYASTWKNHEAPVTKRFDLYVVGRDVFRALDLKRPIRLET